MKPTVLLVTTKNWVPTARLAVALGNAGFRVEALCPRQHPVHTTEAASRTYAYRGLAPLAALARAIATAKPDLIVSGDDLATEQLHELHRRREAYAGGSKELGSLLGNVIERSLGAPAAFAVAQARGAFMKLAREEGIRVPETALLATGDDLGRWVERAGFPTVLKADGTSGGEGVRIVRTAVEAQSAFGQLHSAPLLARALKRALLDQDRTLLWPALSRRKPAVSAQDFIEGHEANSTVACWKGDVLASLHFEVLRKSSAAGHATVVRSMENPEMSAAVQTMVRRMGLSGICGFDFMLEANTGNAYLIEINPRATQVGHLALGAGRDLPAALWAAVTGHPSVAARAVTANDTIALFPQEWARDPQSEFLRSAYHDVPWGTPELVHACMRRSRQQSAWYGRGERGRGTALAPPSVKAAAAQVGGAQTPPESAANRITAR
ncbi:MAG: ATP-grasp domain-containing protein [Terriglobales bacterium]